MYEWNAQHLFTGPKRVNTQILCIVGRIPQAQSRSGLEPIARRIMRAPCAALVLLGKPIAALASTPRPTLVNIARSMRAQHTTPHNMFIANNHNRL